MNERPHLSIPRPAACLSLPKRGGSSRWGLVMVKVVCLLLTCAVLAGCGGAGGESGSAVGVIGGAPTSTPAPTPTPTPTPTGAITGEIKPTPDATFLAASLELTTTGGSSETNGVITGGATNGRLTTLDVPQFSGSYSTQTGYRLTDFVNTAQFGRSQLSVDTTQQNGNGVVVFANETSSAADYLALYQSSTYSSSIKGSGYTTARYAGTGGWQKTVPQGLARHSRLDYFAFGPATPVASMPRTGTVRFTLIGSGNYATDTALWFLTHSSGDTLIVDFAAGTISGSIGVSGENFYKSEVGGIGSIPLRGSFTGNSMTGTFADASLGTSGGVPGQFRLLFVGPNATELILTYVANDGTQAVVGSGVGLVDPYRL